MDLFFAFACLFAGCSGSGIMEIENGYWYGNGKGLVGVWFFSLGKGLRNGNCLLRVGVRTGIGWKSGNL